jgi:hypothetical protein
VGGVTHTDRIFLVDRDGNWRRLYGFDVEPAALAADLRALVDTEAHHAWHAHKSFGPTSNNPPGAARMLARSSDDTRSRGWYATNSKTDAVGIVWLLRHQF